MCDTSNITVGTIVMVKVGRNEIEVVVTEITANGWKVKKVGSDREFIVTRIERVIAEPGAPEAAPATEPEAESAAPEAEEEVDTPNPAPESGGSPEKKLSLLNAALQVLKRSRTPLNTKEILASHRRRSLESEWSKDSGAEPLLRILPRDQGKGDAARPQECRPPGRIRVQQLTEAAGAEVGAGSASRSSSRAVYRGRSSWMYAPKCSGFTS